jgi:hypothetical protein
MYMKLSHMMLAATLGGGCVAAEPRDAGPEDDDEHDHDTASDPVDWDDARTLLTDGGTFQVSVVIEPDPAAVGQPTDLDILAIYADDPEAHLHDVTLETSFEHSESGAVRDDVPVRDRGHGEYRVRDWIFDVTGVWRLDFCFTDAVDEESVSFELYVQP